MALPDIPIGLEYIIAIPTALILIIIFLIWYLIDLRRFGKEAWVFRRCRKKDLPALLSRDIGTGLVELSVGEKDKKGFPVFRNPNDPESLKLDPAMLHNTKPDHWGEGLYMFDYASTQYQPLTTINALGLNKCIKIGREYYPELDFLQDRDLMAFAKMSRDHLEHNAGVVLRKFQPEWENGERVESKEIVNAVIEYQDHLKRVKIDTDLPTAWDAAFAANPVTHMVQDLGEAIKLIEMMVREEYEKMIKMMNYVIMFLMVAGIVIIGVVAMYMTMGR